MQHPDFLDSGIAHNYPQDHVYTLDGACLHQQPVLRNGDNIIYNPSFIGMSTDTYVGDGSVQDLYQHQFQDTPNFGMSQCVKHTNNMENTNMAGNPVFVSNVPSSIMTAHSSSEQSLPTHMNERGMHKDNKQQLQFQGLHASEKSSSSLLLTPPDEVRSFKPTLHGSGPFYQNNQASKQLDTRANGKTYTSYRKDGRVHYDHQLNGAPGNLSNRSFQQPVSRNWEEAVSMAPSTSNIFHNSLNQTNTGYYSNEQHCLASRENFHCVPWQEQHVNMSDKQHWDPNHQQVAEVSQQQFAIPSLNKQQGGFMEGNPTQNTVKRFHPQAYRIQSQEAVGTRCYKNNDALIQPTDQMHTLPHDNVDIFQTVKQTIGKINSSGKHDITTSNVNTSHGSSVATTTPNVFRNRSAVLKQRQQQYPPPGPYKCTWKDEAMCGLEFHDFEQFLLHMKKAHLKLKRKKRDVSSTQNNDRRFQCLWNGCKKIFKAHYKMRSHIMVHTGEKPFTCPYCSVKKRRLETLEIHQRTHTGERPFKCQICSKTFGNSSDRIKHTRTHNEKRWECKAEGCTKRYASSSTLQKHMKDKHSGTKE